ncbi:MAG: glycosyltransferase [Clostridia bacterium]|nr:glycosyltransferase [Clostridia bacterium]
MSLKLTIGAAIYNVGEELLREYIEGIMGQLTDETELLLINDASTDNSTDICKEYAEKNCHIRYIDMGQNQGLSVVRNRTVEEAQGKWIFFADGDDLMSDYCVETALSFYDTDYDIIIHDRKIFIDKKEADPVCTVTKLVELPEEAGRQISLSVLCQMPFDPQSYGMSKEVFYHAAWGALYRKSFIVDNNLQFPPGQKKAQDSVFNTEAYACAKKIAYLPYTMYYYRKNPMGITKRYSEDNAKTVDTILHNQLDCMQKVYPDDEEVKNLYKKNRMVVLVIDRLRLDIFHRNNPKPRKVRKAEFKKLLDTEPYKSTINEFDFGSPSSRWWMLPVEYARKRRFTLLKMCFKYDKLFHLIGKVKISIAKKLKKIGA